MKTTHRVYFENSERMPALPAGSVDLIVTSPPYPMIEMWDGLFTRLSPAARKALAQRQGLAAFEAMHRVLDPVWAETHRILRPGGFACINIGDATRTHRRCLHALPEPCENSHPLPRAWVHAAADHFVAQADQFAEQVHGLRHAAGRRLRHAGARVHPGAAQRSKRQFTHREEKRLRRESAIFWEERNVWYSDVWFDLKGTRQGLEKDGPRRRSGAFPFELAYRLISMFSAKGDTVLDPFLGTGTTLKAAAAAARNSIGFEIEPDFAESIFHRIREIVGFANERVALPDRQPRRLHPAVPRHRTDSQARQPPLRFPGGHPPGNRTVPEPARRRARPRKGWVRGLLRRRRMPVFDLSAVSPAETRRRSPTINWNFCALLKKIHVGRGCRSGGGSKRPRAQPRSARN